MNIEDVVGFAGFYPAPEDTQTLNLPCGEWAFLFDNGMGALVARGLNTPDVRAGCFILSGFNQAKKQPLAVLPANPLVGLSQDEVIDWLFFIHTLGQNGHCPPSLRFPIAHFIYKFREIAPDGWCLRDKEEAHGRKSALGWLDSPDTAAPNEEAEALADIFGGDLMRTVGIAEGLDPRYYDHTHPKEIMLAALRDRLRARNRTRATALTSQPFRDNYNRKRTERGWSPWNI